MKPIIKWAGGKTFISSQFLEVYNQSSNSKRFIDLFCGSLAIPCIIKPENAVFNDINNQLINLYKIVKSAPKKLLKKLEELNNPDYNNKDKFNELRDIFNKNKDDKKLSVEQAGIFIYLNKRSFNGLYRENKDGKYNVPYRKYNTDIYIKEDILSLSKYFKQNNIKFYTRHFTEFSIDFFNNDDIVYIDPPYYPSSKSSFTSYWKTPFGIKEQHILLDFCRNLDKKGVKFILSNSPCNEITDMYSEYNLHLFYIGRQMRSAKGVSDVYDKKEEANEILIWNFKKLNFIS